MHYRATVIAFPIRANQYYFLRISRKCAQESVCEKRKVLSWNVLSSNCLILLQSQFIWWRCVRERERMCLRRCAGLSQCGSNVLCINLLDVLLSIRVILCALGERARLIWCVWARERERERRVCVWDRERENARARVRVHILKSYTHTPRRRAHSRIHFTSQREHVYVSCTHI